MHACSTWWIRNTDVPDVPGANQIRRQPWQLATPRALHTQPERRATFPADSGLIEPQVPGPDSHDQVRDCLDPRTSYQTTTTNRPARTGGRDLPSEVSTRYRPPVSELPTPGSPPDRNTGAPPTRTGRPSGSRPPGFDPSRYLT